MISDVDLRFWIVLWAVTAAYLLIRHWRVGAGTGLLFAYLLGLGALHWFCAVLYLLPWHMGYNRWLTAEGLRQSGIGILALTAGAEVVAQFARRGQLAEAATRAPEPVDDRLIRLYFVAGGVLFACVMPLASRIASLTAFVSTGSLLVVVGVSLCCWNAWVRGQRLRFWFWLLGSCIWPLVTIIGQGFLGYGLGFTLMTFTFVAAFYRPRWRVAVATVLLGYLGLSVYVTYMRDRRDIRAVVWGGAALADRIASVESTFLDPEFFDFHRTDHLMRVEERLNQDALVGAAVAYLASRPHEFAHGATFVQALAALVPRAIWPNKPEVGGSGDLVTTYTGIRFAEGTSVGIGQVMEAYVNFGRDGVIVLFFVIGGILISVDRWSALRLRQGDANGFLVWYLPGLCLLQVGGSLSEVTAAAGASWLMAFAVNRVALYKRWTRGADASDDVAPDAAAHRSEVR
jgi:hypothetical protein